MNLVGTRLQVIGNLQTLEEYRTSRVAMEREFYGNLLRNGICFLVYNAGNQLLLGPSRFIGYVGNNMSRHAANDKKDGRETTPAIEKAFDSSFLEDSNLVS